MESKKYVYTFGNGKAEGSADMKNLLGGKGANLAEMNRIGVPVPPGYTITTEACVDYYKMGKEETIQRLTDQVTDGVHAIEKMLGKTYGDPANPLLLSARSGARVSMPGMMDTVLNMGLNDDIVEGFAKMTGNEWTAWDSYRRFIQMYGDVVLGLKPDAEDDIDPFERIIDDIKDKRNIQLDTDLTVEDLKLLTIRYRELINKVTGQPFPTDPWEQLWGAILAVFDSWTNRRAVSYRKLYDIPEDWGTAVNIQAMVFGNMGDSSATGVAFTRDPATGENLFTGEYLINAQGEDVVAGIRTPQQITLEGSRRWAERAAIHEDERKAKFPSLEEAMPEIYKELDNIQQKLEDHYRDMQDLEFTIQEGKLWLLQTRNGKRTGQAMVQIAIDMLAEGMIDEETALLRLDAEKMDELLHPSFEPGHEEEHPEITKGLPASPGAATGQIVFSADDAEEWANEGRRVILVRMETSPEDIHGMTVAEGILTGRGGMTSHAAVVARGMGKCCVSGAGEISINYRERKMTIGDHVYREGDWLSLNGTTGQVFEGRIPTQHPEISGAFREVMELADRHARMKVRTNADTPADAKTACEFGAQGIGLCRTEHMFFEDDRIAAVREMILAKDTEGRKKALDKLLPYQREDFKGIFKAMKGMPVTIRLLDPPLHEFLPHDEESKQEMAKNMGVTYEEVESTINSLQELNPMLGHRGCRLANTYPEITEMQTRAILEAAISLKKNGMDTEPEIMVPLISVGRELRIQMDVIRATALKVFREHKMKVPYKMGTMIEIPRAALIADKIAHCADFFSFGTNDLTQMTFGFSRDDVGKFLPIYMEKGILEKDVFQTIDQSGVGQLVEIGTQKGRSVKSDLKVGVCGEHGGDPKSIEFFHRTGLDYVSCSPFRVPVARLVAAQATIMAKKGEIPIHSITEDACFKPVE